MLRYRNLTLEQIDYVANGCGGKGGWLKVPDWVFGKSCDHHDFNYWLGHTEADRVKADWQFYESMVEAANALPWYKKYFARVTAWTYYTAVKWFAKSFFYYGEEERTLEDLEAEMNSFTDV